MDVMRNPLRRGGGAMMAAVLMLGASAALLSTVPSAGALTQHTADVFTDEDDGSCVPGDCSLREALDAASGDGDASEIILLAGTYEVTLGTLEDTTVEPLTFTGTGAATTIIDATTPGASIALSTGDDTTLAGLTLLAAPAEVSDTVGVSVSGTLVTDHVVIDVRSAEVGVGAYGVVAGAARITDSTIRVTASATDADTSTAYGVRADDTSLVRSSVVVESTGDAYGVDVGGGDARNTTFSVRTTGGESAARIWSTEGIVDVVEVTAVADGSEAYLFQTSDGSEIANSILMGACTGNKFLSNGGNVVLVGSGCEDVAIAANDRVVADAALLPLADNGGPGPTFLITQASPAFDIGLATSCSATDERGVPRPQFSACDSGAVEIAPEVVPAVPLEPTFTG